MIFEIIFKEMSRQKTPPVQLKAHLYAEEKDTKDKCLSLVWRICWNNEGIQSEFILRGYNRVCINNTDLVLTEFDNDGKSHCHLSFRQIRIITGRPAGRHVGNAINQKKCFPL